MEKQENIKNKKSSSTILKDSLNINKRKQIPSLYIIILIVAIAFVMIFNQWQISSLNISGNSIKIVSAQEIDKITSTGQAVASLFPVEEISSEEDAIAMMIPQGTPEYGGAMGISFDDPINSMELLAKSYDAVKQDIKQNYPEVWQRYLNLATKPVGISCEFCCGVGPIGITKSGELRCGCQHNPAVQTLTMLLMKDTDYTDAEVLREVMRWKALFFPRDMVELALKSSGGELETSLPGMVGGC